MPDLHLPDSFKPLLLPSTTATVSTKWQPVGGISGESFLMTLSGDKKKPPDPRINFELTLQNKKREMGQVGQDKPLHSTENLS